MDLRSTPPERFSNAFDLAQKRRRPQPATFADGVECVKVIEALSASAAAGGAMVEPAAG
jgi:hypothetical protein